jgi:adenine-specific DNA-methyltransferase
MVAFDDQKLLSNHTVIVFVPWHYLSGVRNKSIKKTAKYRKEVKGKRPAVLREELEELSKRFQSKYLLAIMNSTLAKRFVNARRRSKLDIYPDDWKLLPIAPISLDEQQSFVELVDAILGEFDKHGYPLPADAAARVTKIEREIDERVAALYGVALELKEK